MAKNYVRENIPLSRFGVLVAQLESIVASAAAQPPEALLCFDLLSDLVSAIEEEPKESILLWQRKCEDALYSLLTMGARRPVRHLVSVAMARIISKGDPISIYSRASTLQGFLSDGKRSEPQRVAGAAQCLGELYRYFGRRITSGLLETTIILSKLMKFHEDFVRKEALYMLQNALEGSGGCAASSAYTEAFRIITRSAIVDKSFVVRIAAARCLKAFADIGGPGLGVGELDSSASHCVKALEDPVSSVRDAFAEALGLLLALGMNPEAQVQPRGKGPFPIAKKLEGGLQRHLILPFTKASGARSKDIRLGITLSWVSFLQAIRFRYLHPDSELQSFTPEILSMLHTENSADTHAQACVMYILRVAITDQMTEPTQRSFLVFLGQQLQSSDGTAPMKIAALRTLSYTLKTVGEVPYEFKEVFDDTIVAAILHSSELVRIEAAMMIRTYAEVDPTCVGGLTSFGVTTLNALRETVSFEKGSNLGPELNSLHGQALALAALVSISPKLPLGYPSRLPQSVLDISRKMLLQSSCNPVAETVEKEAGWLLLSSLLASMPKEELEDQVFDILSIWAPTFSGDLELGINIAENLPYLMSVWSAAVDALTAFVRCFVSSNAIDDGILLQPVLVYLSRALAYLLLVSSKELSSVKTALDIYAIRILVAYQSLPDPVAYKSDHSQLLQFCATPYRDSECEESTCLKSMLDKRDAWLGPWIPGRDLFEDELRAFQGGKDGLMPSIWDNELSTFPLPETVKKTVLNQKLLCFGTIFACLDDGGMLSIIGIIEQSIKAGKKQPWHAARITNICVGLLSGLKALHSFHPRVLGLDVLSSLQAIFQSILAEGGICPSQRRASAEGLGLLARFGNDAFTARMTRSLLGELTMTTDTSYAGSVALALGCIHRCAGGMALSSLVPPTVSSISMLAKTPAGNLQIWTLHGLLLSVEAAGLSYISHVQAILGLALHILLSEENGWVDLQQAIGRLINAIVAVIGPELAPGSIFFSRCKSVIGEISSCQETATLLENVRFTQQLILFAPQAVPLHCHVQNLLPTLSSKQPILRHLAISTLRHLIEKDPGPIMDEQIEDGLFHMLDEETDSEIGNLVQSTIMRLLYATCPSCPAHWISVCRDMVLSISTRRNFETNRSTEGEVSNGPDDESNLDAGEDDENMVSHSRGMPMQGYIYESSKINKNRDKHLRYRTRIFAAECLRHLPAAVGKNPAHFDLSMARSVPSNGCSKADWLVLHVQELISLAYQISTIQFESMQPIGVELLSAIVDKFQSVHDPELPEHLLLEQYQAQLVSAVRTALDASSGPPLLEAGLQLATKIMTSGIITSDRVAIRRIYSLVSGPLDDFSNLYYPSFAEWVSCKIKIRLLAAQASLKCYTYAFLRGNSSEIPEEYATLLPLFAKSSTVLGKFWIQVLKDYSYIGLRLHLKKNWAPFLDGMQLSLVISKLQPCLREAWPVILQALALDAVPEKVNLSGDAEKSLPNNCKDGLISGYSMVELKSEDYRFVWAFSLVILFNGEISVPQKSKVSVASSSFNHIGDSKIEETTATGFKFYEVVLPVFQFLSTERFFNAGFLTVEICQELLQVFAYSIHMCNARRSFAISVLSQIVKCCPDNMLEEEKFCHLAVELCLAYLFDLFQSSDAVSVDYLKWEDLVSALFITANTLMRRIKPMKIMNAMVLALVLIGYKGIAVSPTESCFLKANDFVKSTSLILKSLTSDISEVDGDAAQNMSTFCEASLNIITDLTQNCIEGIHMLESKLTGSRKLIQTKLAFCFEQAFTIAKLAHGCLLQCKNEKASFCSVLKRCAESMRFALIDSNIQVQAIGLQMLKGILQRESTAEDNSFSMFFAGELITAVLSILQNTLKASTRRESSSIGSECLRILVLLQTMSKDSICQKALMTLLLETVIMVSSIPEDGSSEAVNDVKSIAIKLVSHLVQVPSSATLCRDVLSSMPVTQRQQLQAIIRQSVSPDHNTIQTKAAALSLEIKLPLATEEIEERASVSVTNASYREDVNEDGEEEDDDWDTFQSFPASTSAVAADSGERNKQDRNDLTENSSSYTSSQVKSLHTLQGTGDTQELVSEGIIPKLQGNQALIIDDHVSETHGHLWEKGQMSLASDENVDSENLDPVSTLEGTGNHEESTDPNLQGIIPNHADALCDNRSEQVVAVESELKEQSVNRLTSEYAEGSNEKKIPSHEQTEENNDLIFSLQMSSVASPVKFEGEDEKEQHGEKGGDQLVKLSEVTEEETQGPPDTREETGNRKKLDVEDIDPNLLSGQTSSNSDNVVEVCDKHLERKTEAMESEKSEGIQPSEFAEGSTEKKVAGHEDKAKDNTTISNQEISTVTSPVEFKGEYQKELHIEGTQEETLGRNRSGERHQAGYHSPSEKDKDVSSSS